MTGSTGLIFVNERLIVQSMDGGVGYSYEPTMLSNQDVKLVILVVEISFGTNE